MYRLAHFLRDHLPFIWDFVDWMNGALFTWRYGRKMKALPEMLEALSWEYKIVELSSIQSTDLEMFFASQPEESFKFFKPHGFDDRSIRKLQRNGDSPIGYFFLRSFFFGKAYLGKMVDYAHQGKGIGKMMCLCAIDIASTLGLRMFETISKDNLSSLYSTQKVLETRIVEEMPDNYLMIEDLRRKE